MGNLMPFLTVLLLGILANLGFGGFGLFLLHFPFPFGRLKSIILLVRSLYFLVKKHKK